VPEAAVELWVVGLGGSWPGPDGLPAAERERAGRLATAELRRRWSASRWALRTVLADRSGVEPAALAIELGSGGKPRLVDGGPRFSLSHSGELALIAICEEVEVGVDIERIDRDRDVLRLARRGLDEEAAAAIRSARPEHRADAFYAAWTRREAIAKCRGAGIWGAEPPAAGGSGGPAGIAVAGLAGPAGYAAALALAAETMPPLRWRRATPPR
jgi:4'-phosphopantetheinyl transferase